MTTFTEKYASVAGAGAHDGSSPANAWTMAEATANVVAGNRVNCLAGTYIADDSASSSVMDIDVAGTVGNWIEWRAYTTTIGDFLYGTAPPVVANAGTNTLTNAMQTTTIGAASAFNRFIGFQFTGASSHGASGGTTTDEVSFEGCKFDNNGGRGCQGDNTWEFLLCEFTANTTNSVDADATLILYACLFHNESGPVVTAAAGPVVINCLAYDNGNTAYFNFGQPVIFSGNTLDGDNGAASIGVTITGATNIPHILANNIFFDFNVGVNYNNAGIEDSRLRGFNYFSSCNTNYDNLVDATTDIDDGTTDPFTNSATRDYTLASGSNAIGAGADAGNFA